MQGRYLAAACGVLLAAGSAFADGYVVGPSIDPWFLTTRPRSGSEDVAVEPVIPDQRALIVHADGRETLVIETAFSGAGTDFAWIVPTPSVPKIATASTDLFPRLADATRPSLISETPDLRFAGLFVISALLLARHGGRRGARAAGAVVTGAALFGLLFGGFAPEHGGPQGVLTLGSPLGGRIDVPMTPAEEMVAVKQREVVGVFDAVTLSARDPQALVAWLRGNGYSVPAGLEAVASDYVRDGWVFNAMRLHREADAGTVRIHPVSFTFDAPAPVYPMRLTGVRGTPVAVELFVVGSGRAGSDGFAVARCALIDTDDRHEDDPGRVVLSDDSIRPLVRGGAVLTRLDRTFLPEAMKSDAPVAWTEFEPAERTVFSETAAAALAWNAACVLAIGALIGTASAATSASRRRRPGTLRRCAATALILIIALDAGLAVAAFAPTVDTRPRATIVPDAQR